MLRLFSNGGNLLEEPQRWLPVKLADVCAALNEFAEEAAESLNFYVESQRDSALANGTTFDPKTIFKSKSGVLQLETRGGNSCPLPAEEKCRLRL